MLKKKGNDKEKKNAKNENEKIENNNPAGEEAQTASETVVNQAENGNAEPETSDNKETETEKNNSADAGSKDDNKSEEKKISEAEFFKLYLQQTMEELKKAKKENDDLKKELENSKSQVLQVKQKYENLVEEYDNYRRRTASEKEALSAEAIAKAVVPLLPALDNLERAMPFAETNPESFKQGVEMTLKQLTDGFKSLNVEEIEAEGAAFDPSVHNAVMHVDDDSLPEGVVAEVFQKGYKIGDRVIRHAMVKVAN